MTGRAVRHGTSGSITESFRVVLRTNVRRDLGTSPESREVVLDDLQREGEEERERGGERENGEGRLSRVHRRVSCPSGYPFSCAPCAEDPSRRIGDWSSR